MSEHNLTLAIAVTDDSSSLPVDEVPLAVAAIASTQRAEVLEIICKVPFEPKLNSFKVGMRLGNFIVAYTDNLVYFVDEQTYQLSINRINKAMEEQDERSGLRKRNTIRTIFSFIFLLICGSLGLIFVDFEGIALAIIGVASLPFVFFAGKGMHEDRRAAEVRIERTKAVVATLNSELLNGSYGGVLWHFIPQTHEYIPGSPPQLLLVTRSEPRI